jgi:hypothetical protein
MSDFRNRLKCPSAQPTMAGATVLGVIDPDATELKVLYALEKVPVNQELLQLCGELPPTRFIRFAAPCEERKCQHFDGQNCQLATRIIQILPGIVNSLPPCSIRQDCRWYFQEGAKACQRCPQIITSEQSADPLLQDVAYGTMSSPVGHQQYSVGSGE